MRKHLATSLELLITLGFVINMKKSVTQLDQVMEFLGFVLDSNRMSISLPNQIPTESSKQAQGLRIRARKAASTSVRNDGGSTSSNPSCTITLQIPQESQSESPEEGLSI